MGSRRHVGGNFVTSAARMIPATLTTSSLLWTAALVMAVMAPGMEAEANTVAKNRRSSPAHFQQYQDYEAQVPNSRSDYDFEANGMTNEEILRDLEQLRELKRLRELLLIRSAAQRAEARKKRRGSCLFNAGLAHNCEYRDLVGAVNEADHWGSDFAPGKRR